MLKTKTKNTKDKKVKAQAPEKSRALVTRPAKEVSTRVVVDFKADAGGGQETMTQQDFAIPRIVILQDLSPQVKEREDKYIENAEAGDICDIVGNVLYDGEKGILAVPISYRRSYIEWIPRSKGGGFVADHTATSAAGDKRLQDLIASCSRTDKGKLITPSGNELRISGEYFIFMVDESESGSYHPFVLTMSSTQAKKSRRWNTAIRQLTIEVNGERINPAMWYRSYRLISTPERNDKGSWFGWSIVPGEITTDLPNGVEMYKDAKAFHKSVKAGRVSVAAPEEEEIPGAPDDDDIAL